MQMPWEISENEAKMEIVGLKNRDRAARYGNGRLRRYIGEKCPYCPTIMNRERGYHSPQSPSRDHRVPTCRGGMNVESNIIICCRRCNEEKGPLDEDEFMAWKAGLATRLDSFWDKLRQQRKNMPRYPYIHYARLRTKIR